MFGVTHAVCNTAPTHTRKRTVCSRSC